MSTHPIPHRDPARAEPRTIGTGGSRGVLQREVRLLGALLGEVIVEQVGRDVFEIVESTRQRAIAARRGDAQSRVALGVTELDGPTLTVVVRAFGLYFQLVNLAETRDRVRSRARRARATRGASEGAAIRDAFREALGAATAARDAADARSLLDRLSIVLVLTAHPTEARRRTLLLALRRIARPSRALRRPAPRAIRGSRAPPPAARGDRAPVGERGDPERRAEPVRRGSNRDGLLRRDHLPPRAEAVSGSRAGRGAPIGAAA